MCSQREERGTRLQIILVYSIYLENLSSESLVQALTSLRHLALVVHAPEHLGRSGVSSEAHHDLLSLANLEVVECLGMISWDREELNIKINTGHVLISSQLISAMIGQLIQILSYDWSGM